jgi:DNA-binding MarR family transcriptional regulator
MTSSTPAASPAPEAASAVLETVPLVMRAIRDRMREGRQGMSVPQFRALAYIRHHPGTNLSALSAHLGISLPSASLLVERLVRQDLVTRETDPASRRRIRLTLSTAGLVCLEAAQVRTTEWLLHILDRLGPARLGGLVDGLHDLRALIAREDESTSPAP